MQSKGIGIELHTLPIEGETPNGGELSIDIAILARGSEGVLIHSSGIHGVEGFSGSAVQCNLLERVEEWYTGDVGVIFIHIVNPWGMAWGRRVNSNNVDLNRNFLGDDEEYSGIPDDYVKISGLINPHHPPRKLDMIFPKALLTILRLGKSRMKQAIAEGQYENEKGVFYGGDSLQLESASIIEILTEELVDVNRVLHIDFHTGLGKFGEDSLIVSDGGDVAGLTAVFGQRIEASSTDGVSYLNRGGFPGGLAGRWENISWVGITQEFGTFSEYRMLKWMIRENQMTHWSGLDQLSCFRDVDRVKFMLGFNPDELEWKSAVLWRGSTLFEQGLEMLR